MSAKVQGWVWEQDLLPQRKLLLLWLANRATDAGVCFPSKRELAEHTGLRERMVRYHLAWLASDQDEDGLPKVPLLQIIERPVDGERNTSNVYVICVPWARPQEVRAELEELKHVPSEALNGVSATGCTQGGGCNPLHPVDAAGHTQVGATGCTENRPLKEDHRESPPQPPTGAQQQGEAGEIRHPGTGVLPGMRTSTDSAQTLVAAFYHGLGAVPSTATPTMQRRDLAIARQLVEAGATPGEAEAYARETSGLEGRLAPVDLRSFERERPGWLARQRRQERRYTDRTGLPPSWLAGTPELACTPTSPPQAESPPDDHGAAAGVAVPATVRGGSNLSGEQLGCALRTALLAGTH